MTDSNNSHALAEAMITRTRELKAQGLDWPHASSVAWLEERVKQWPSGWGDDLHVLLYGDFYPPDEDISFPKLGITVKAGKLENTVIHGALTVIKAIVTVPEKSVAAIIDAGRRVNLLLGIETLWAWGNSPSGWWSWVTHDMGGAGLGDKFGRYDVGTSIDRTLVLPAVVRRKVEAAMFWYANLDSCYFSRIEETHSVGM